MCSAPGAGDVAPDGGDARGRLHTSRRGRFLRLERTAGAATEAGDHVLRCWEHDGWRAHQAGTHHGRVPCARSALESNAMGGRRTREGRAPRPPRGRLSRGAISARKWSETVGKDQVAHHSPKRRYILCQSAQTRALSQRRREIHRGSPARRCHRWLVKCGGWGAQRVPLPCATVGQRQLLCSLLRATI